MTTANPRVQLSEGVGFTEILDPKFKTNTLRVHFYQPLSPENASACALAGDIITSCSKAYPANADLTKKLHLLYGASLGCSVSRNGDMQTLMLQASAIADRYALDGEAILEELIDILTGCLLEPNVTNGAFDETEFRIRHSNLLDNIDAEINDKRQYAILQAHRTAYQGEPAAYSCYGERQQAAALTPASVYDAYCKMLQSARIEIFFVGPEAVPDLRAKLQDIFAAVAGRTPRPLLFDAPSPLKPAPVTTCESLPVNQCKLVLSWKVGANDRYAVKLAALLLGGTTTSKLFTNVREKLSLCYYCAAGYAELKHTLTVDSGIEESNIEKAKAAILQQLKDIQEGSFTDDELQSARMAVHNTMRGIGDTPSSYVTWYQSQMFRSEQLTPAQEEANYAAVTKEQIITAANTMQLDTIYIMKCAEQEADADGNN